ncbi:hypothetical protein PG994_009301 [Apiospora phragmitis]|uniref:Rhodopsin domain-containing protein n=1 Tax=Apiospora phragmitis TaxID=2905665 RepID=A0ABR1UIW7_9PEZI
MASLEASPSGDELSAMAYTLPPIRPNGLGLAAEVVLILCSVISSIVVLLRIWVRAGFSRVGSAAWGADDSLVVTEFVSFPLNSFWKLPYIPASVFGVCAVRYGVGSYDEQLPNPLYQMRAFEYIIYWELLYFISSTIIECAIGVTCIRIDRRRRITYSITFYMCLMIATAIGALIFVFANCRPFAANWNPSLGKCQQVITLTTVSYIVSTIQMVTDWACAIIPFFIVADLQMPCHAKISVVCILGLGILASIATCVRMPYLKYWDAAKYPENLLYHVAVTVICSNIENSLGVIACSLPPLRKLFRSYSGSSGDHINSKDTNSSQGHPVKLTPLNNDYRASAQSGTRANGWEELDDDCSSRKGIVRKTDIAISIK